jgi:O-antigen/teichoic acid export membrane protein
MTQAEPTPDAAGKADGLTVREVRDRAISGTILLTARGAALQVAGLASTIVVAHFFTPGELGKVAFGLTLTTLLLFAGGSQGLAGALIRMQETPRRVELETGIGLQLAIGLLIALATTAIGWQFGEVGHLTALMVWAVPLAAFRVPALTMLERRLAYRQIVTASFVEILFYQGWQIVTVIAGWGVWGLASAVICRSVAGTAAMIVLSDVRYLRPRLHRQHSRHLVHLGIRIQAGELLDALRDQGLNLTVGATAGLSALGLWSMAYRALQIPTTIFASLARVSFPGISRLITLGEDPKPLVEEAVAVTAPACGLILVPLAASSPALFPAVLGHKWAGAAAVIPPASLGLMLAIPVAVAAVGYLWAIGDGDTPLRGSIANAAVWFGVALPLLPAIGVSALGWGMLAALVSQATVLARGVRKHLEVHFARHVIVSAAIAVAAATGPWLVVSLAQPTILTAIAGGAVAVLLYTALLFLLHRQPTRRLARLVLPPLAARMGVRLPRFATGT